MAEHRADRVIDEDQYGHRLHDLPGEGEEIFPRTDG